MQKKVNSLAELEAGAKHFIQTLKPSDSGATLVTLCGELGAGKTAFTKAIAKALGVEETVNSPTFVLEKIYQLPPPATFSRLVHIDAYRLESGADLAPLGFDELMQDAGNLIILEWPEKVAEALPAPTKSISIVIEQDESRIISYD